MSVHLKWCLGWANDLVRALWMARGSLRRADLLGATCRLLYAREYQAKMLRDAVAAESDAQRARWIRLHAIAASLEHALCVELYKLQLQHQTKGSANA